MGWDIGFSPKKFSEPKTHFGAQSSSDTLRDCSLRFMYSKRNMRIGDQFGPGLFWS